MQANTDKPRVFTAVLTWTLLVWAVLGVLVTLVLWRWMPKFLPATILINCLSGLIALVSLIPGLVQEWVPNTRANGTYSGQDKIGQPGYIGPLFAGIFLRLAGTVALFVMCRYQLAVPELYIAGFILGWYVVLTLVEATLLARKLSKLDGLSPSGGDANSPPFDD